MKKILLFIILLSSFSLAQTTWWWGWGIKGNAYNKSYTPYLLDTNYYQTSNIQQFVGANTMTKVSKDSGGTRFVDYIKVWTLGLNDPLTYDNNTLFLYDGDAELTTAAWGDQSGNNYDLTLNNAPTITRTLNEHNTVYFNGVNENAQRFTTPIMTDSMTFYFVMKQYSWNSGAKIFRPASSAIGILQQDLFAPDYNLATGTVRISPPFGLDEWGVITVTRQGTTGGIRNATNPITMGTALDVENETGLNIAGHHPDELEFAYIIGRDVIDNASTQNLFISFLGTEFDLLGADSVRGNIFNLPINVGNSGVKYYWQYYGYWIEKDKDKTWVYSAIDSVTLPAYWDCQPRPVAFGGDVTNAELDSNYQAYLDFSGMVIYDINCDSILAYSTSEYRTSPSEDWLPSDSFYVFLGDTLNFRVLSSSEYWTTESITFTLYSPTIVTNTWNVKTKSCDTIPSNFSLTSITNAELNTVYQDSMIVTGIVCDVNIELGSGTDASGEYKIGVLGGWTNLPDRASISDTIFVRLTSSELYSVKDSLILSLNGVSDVFSITTKAAPTPDNYYVVDKAGNKALLFKNGTYAIKFKD